MFDKILIANRGEIACRVIRTARRMGIRTVAVYSEADADAQHVRLADEAHPIGGPRPQDSYLRGDAILKAAKESGAQAIHPGYGFLSENADFADAVEAAGIVFIGPKAGSMRRMGSKAGAKELMQAAGVPVVPGYTGEDQSPDTLQREADRIGYPLMIKAAHGGGGKGMRIVRCGAEFASNLESCQREAANAFGRDRVLLERYIEHPRHIEIQIFGDAQGNLIHLNERECSAQRRYQKVLEESPSPLLTPELRAAMGEAAVAAGRAIDYQNAGTVEFIVGRDGRFYFMEINTRLQVEHPVTEMVTGLDLVEWQLRVAAGEPLPRAQHAIYSSGHAIEVRLYAEDPAAGFLPGSGKLTRLRLPEFMPETRIDSGVIEGDTVTIFYDPMIAKLIVHSSDRPRALARLREALAACEIEGPKSNIAFLERLARHPAVVEGTIDTGYLDRHLDEFLDRAGDDREGPALRALAATALRLRDAARSRPRSPWEIVDGWRLGGGGHSPLRLRHGEHDAHLKIGGKEGDFTVREGDVLTRLEGLRLSGNTLSGRVNGHARRLLARVEGDAVRLHDGTHGHHFLRIPLHHLEDEHAPQSDDALKAPMPGRVVLVKARPGDTVEAGSVVLVMEAMKMELALKAPRQGVIAELRAAEGDFVEADAILATLEH
ncbi:acetyl/propionyl/methylcrotonyl-CoA carboxylase subunit alpha [Lysobacter pythonis]|uniref:Biotin carboxylase n=1 Tax=Solilutibacter pythonis TaxID=2483112 RepID=A0A3M2HM37_9GAMM|nr:acetyl/propionyl/methylcrotonyl-CoA carboxylase subunit alpha [Lysobacter pythonis]RMH90776.1 acetyl/propionyl/methylcrotonyl-CoA carboxylase subunit alpha [Lysobacter pythonis]